MVFRGTPSQACQLCRLRKVKCDETRPSCRVCVKTRRQCPGYKKDVGHTFWNGQVRGANRRAVADAVGASWSLAVSRQSIMAALNPSLEDLAECHFVTNFDLLPTQGTARGSMDYLLPILKREALHQDFRHAFRACALALFNNRLQSQRRPCARSALLEYTQALQKTNRALRDPDTQRKDTTLAAVLLLALFETLTKTNIEAWGAHIDGAIQLVQLRGKGQLNTEIGVLLFTSVRTQMIIYSLTCAKPPDVSIDWWTDRSVHNTCAAQCQRIIVATAELRAAITRLVGSTSPTPEHNGIMDRMVRACEAVDNEAVRWMKQVPEAWRYHTVAWEDHMPEGADDLAATPVYPGRVDVYADHYVASLWNMARTARLILASVMVRSAAWRCRPLDVRTTPEYAVASRRCTETIAAILASVPFHLGGHAGQAGYAQGWSGGGDRSSPKCLAGYFLIWPLSCARSQDYATDNQRAWIQGRLRFIGDNLGVKHAHTLADLNLRLPSMLIHSDELKISRDVAAVQGSGLVEASQTMVAGAGYTRNPLQQREAMVRENAESGRTVLLAEAAALADPQAQWVAKKWLCV